LSESSESPPSVPAAEKSANVLVAPKANAALNSVTTLKRVARFVEGP